ncbi:MAG: hypothetical protein Q8O00_13215 [Holophaga sp.]|nr:hypothetical protein [Holophaga sp.]
MNDVMQDPEWRRGNVVSLNELLQGADPFFRKTVQEILALESFEMDETLPNLQLPVEILDAIGEFKGSGSRQDWDVFRANLMAFGEAGILVDLSPFDFETDVFR